MYPYCDEDSGRSSCSVASGVLSPVIDHYENEELQNQMNKKILKTDMTKTDLKVSVQPRSFPVMSPDDKDPFPCFNLKKAHKKPVFHLLNSPRMGGLSNAHSTFDIPSSTHIEQEKLEKNAVSLNAVEAANPEITKFKQNPNFRRSKPVQRAASRLYKADCGFKGKDGCVGPEFIVRASQSAKSLDLTHTACTEKKIVTVVLLNGQKVDIICDPDSVTAGQLFEALVYSEHYEHSFMLGIATLLGGDFIFLPDDYKIKKIATENWYKTNKKKRIHESKVSVTVFLRIKFFLPSNIAKNIQAGEWRHRVYLQLRRATVEGQLSSTIQNIILLTGYALHIEFGEFSYREHGTADYFLLEHYLPESFITSDMSDIKLRMKKAHESRRGLEKNKAILNYITLAQTFRDYGAHFYSAIWSTRDGFCRDVWLSIGPRGITLYSRTNYNDDSGSSRIVLQSLAWHHIHTFYYNKKSLYIIPNSSSGLSKAGIKYKLKMADNKTYFTFWLASLHHRLYLKLYAKEDFVNYLSDGLSVPLKSDIPKTFDCSNYQDSYNLAVRNPIKAKKPTRRRFKVDLFTDKKSDKENAVPNTEELLKEILVPQSDDNLNVSFTNIAGNSSNDCLSSSDCSLPRRHGVKMGTRVFKGMQDNALQNKYPKSSTYTSSNECLKSDGDLATTQSDSDDLSSEQRHHCKINSMKLLPARNYNQDLCHTGTAYVLESPKVYSDIYNYNGANESGVNSSLFEKLDDMGCVQGERVFITAQLERNETNALGLQVAEGSDGNVYIKSITPGGPADLCKKLSPGDQIISVNGQTLLNVKYDKALSLLQSAPQKVELIVLQICNKSHTVDNKIDTKIESISRFVKEQTKSMASGLDMELLDDEVLNEEALKTIYALIKLTKDKVVNKMLDRASQQNTPMKSNLQKCYSENKVYDAEIDNLSAQQSTPQKKHEKFNSWRVVNKKLPKRRPLSLSIPSNVNLPDNFLDDGMDRLMSNPSIKSIQSSLNSLNRSEKSTSSKCVALPRNFGLSRRWLGPVRYPVTPCKNSNNMTEKNCEIMTENVSRRYFVYGAGDSDEDQIFL